MTPEELASAIQNRYPTGDLITGGTFVRAELAKLIRENMPPAETNDRKQQTLSDGRIVSIANTLLEEFLILKHGKTARWQTIADVIRREIARYNGQPDPQPTPEAPKWTPSDTHSECENCARVWPNDKLSSIEKASERIAPGEPMPSGQCPECGCLCHPLESSIDSKPATDES